MKNQITLIIFIFFCIGNFLAQNQITATLIDKDTKQPVEFASIALKPNSSKGVMSDDNGRFTIKTKSNKDSLYIMHMAYLYNVVAVKDIKDEIKLTPIKTTLDTVNVSGLGPKGILNLALKKVKKNFYQSGFAIQADSYMYKKKNKQFVNLSYERTMWRIITPIFLTILVPNECVVILSDNDTTKKPFEFDNDDMVYYYDVAVLNNKWYRKSIKQRNDDYTMKIIMQDSIEAGYIITQTEKNDTLYAQSNSNPIKEIKYYIQADDFSIQKIEARLINTKTAKQGEKDKKKRITSWITTVQFSKYNNKYYLSNCFSKVNYFFTKNPMDKYEEKIIFEAIEFYENAPGFYDGKTTKTIKPIRDLVRSDVFRSFIR